MAQCTCKCTECGQNSQMMDGLCWPCLLDRSEQRKNEQYLQAKEVDSNES